MRSNRLAVLLVALLPAAGLAADLGDQYDFTRITPGAAQKGMSCSYGTYNIFGTFSNPALLGYQPRTWEAGASEEMLMGGDENLMTFAGGWVGQRAEAGNFGLGARVSVFDMTTIKQMDMDGNLTGVEITPAATSIGVMGVYQWGIINLGVAASMAQENFDYSKGLDIISNDNPMDGWAAKRSAVLFDAGTAIALGKMNLGVAALNIGGPMVLNVGGARMITGFFNGSIGLEGNIPLAASTPAEIGGGLTWDAAKYLSLRVGLVNNGYSANFNFGLTGAWKDYTLDYAFTTDEMGYWGITNTVSLGWRFGAERKALNADGPKFFTESKERTMAVSNFEPQNVSAGDAAVISDMLRNQMIREGAFNMVEKANMDKVLQEQAFQQTGCTSSECAVKLGKVLNVKYLVVGGFGKVMDQYMLNMRVIDVETAKAIYSDEAIGKNLQEIRDGIKVLAAKLTVAVNAAK
jgi:hypothetical protein